MSLSDVQASAGISKHLSNLATSYTSDPSLYVADRVAMPLHQTGVVAYNFQRNQAGWSDLSSTHRAKGSPAMTLDDENEQLISGFLDDNAVRSFLSERDFLLREQAGVSRQQVIENAVRRVTGSLMINREYKLASLLTTSGNYNANNSGAAAAYWTAGTSGSDPVADVLGAMSEIAKGPCAGGEYYMVADESIWLTLMGNEQIRKACGGISFAPSIEDIGRILHVRPIVSKAKYNGGNSMFGKNAVIFKRPEIVDPFDENANCSFRLIHNTELPVTIKTYKKEELDGMYVEGQSNYEIISPYADANNKINSAFLITGVVA